MNNSSDMIEVDMTVAVESKTEKESHIDYSRIAFMILCLTALIMIAMIIISYVRAIRRRHVVNDLATQGEQAEMATEVQCDDDEEGHVKIKTENNIAEQGQEEQEQHLKAEVQHRQHSVQRMPKGILTILAILIALSLSIATQTSCRFISSPQGIDLVRHPDNQVVKVMAFGLWSAAIYDGSYGSDKQCQSIFLNGFPVDGKIVFARVAAVLASALGSIALIASLYYAFSGRLDSPGFHRISWGLSLAVCAQALVMVIQYTDLCDSWDACEPSNGAGFPISASVYWFIAALSIIFIQVPRGATI